MFLVYLSWFCIEKEGGNIGGERGYVLQERFYNSLERKILLTHVLICEYAVKFEMVPVLKHDGYVVRGWRGFR